MTLLRNMLCIMYTNPICCAVVCKKFTSAYTYTHQHTHIYIRTRNIVLVNKLLNNVIHSALCNTNHALFIMAHSHRDIFHRTSRDLEVAHTLCSSVHLLTILRKVKLKLSVLWPSFTNNTLPFVYINMYMLYHNTCMLVD